MRPLTLFLAIVVLAGCESSPELGVGTPGDLLVHSYLAPEDRPKTPEGRRALSLASRDALKSTGTVFRTSASWAEADQRIRALIDAETDPVRQRRLEETAATRMLQPDVLCAASSPEALDATGAYVEMLIRHGSPDAPLIADALDRLRNYWTTDRVVGLAQDAAAALDAYAQRHETCEDCSAESQGPSPTAASGRRSVYEAQFGEAERRIYVLAGRE